MAGGLVEMIIPAGWTFDNDPKVVFATGTGVTDLSATSATLSKVVFRLDDTWSNGGTATITINWHKSAYP